MAKDKEEARGEPTEETQSQAADTQSADEVRSTTQEYLVVVKIGGAGDPEVFLAGSRITLDDERARPHLENGNIQPLNHSSPPPAPITVQVVHDAPLSRRGRG